MADEIKVIAQSRKEKGSSAARRLRAKGLLPGILYSAGKANASSIELKEHEFTQLLRHHTSEHLIMNLEVDGVDKTVLLQEVQHHTMSNRLLHVDFMEVSMTERLRVTIPIALIGEPIGVSLQGGVIDHPIREVEVECLPTDISEEIEINISGLHIGESLLVSDLPLDPEKYSIITASDIAVAAVAAPRVQEEETEEGEDADAILGTGEATEPEMIKEKKEEE